MSQSTIIVLVKPKGNWKSNLHRYAGFHNWLPFIDLQALSEHEAKEKVICHYLSGFGPATIDNIAWWIGISKREVKQILEKNNEINYIEINGLEGSFVILKSDLERLLAFSANEDIVNLLPKFDPYIMGYKNRQRLISKEHEKKIYWSTRGEVSPTILFNGQIIGTWNPKEEKGKSGVILSFFEKMDKKTLYLVKQEAEKLVYSLNDSEHTIPD